MADYVYIPCGGDNNPDCPEDTCSNPYSITEEDYQTKLASGEYCLQGIYDNVTVGTPNGYIDAVTGYYDEDVPPSNEDLRVLLDYRYNYDYRTINKSTDSLTISEWLDIIAILPGEIRRTGCGPDIDDSTIYYTNGSWFVRYSLAIASMSIHKNCTDWECPPNSHKENGTCIPNEGWEWCFEGSNELCPKTPGIPSGPDPLPPYLPPSIPPEEGVCPDCYTLDIESNLCVYTGGEGCEPVECITTAKCDATPITGVCEGRDDCI